ncbi:MAG: triose-phosphate isomerase family protein, partial [Solirubrobacterales bacterium]
MSDRMPYMAANWKMHKTVAEAEAFFADFLPRVGDAEGVDIVVCPPYLALTAAVDACAGSSVRIAAQNMHEEESGAFTGEVSAPMLNEIGVDAVVLGHSERRTYFAESDAALANKVPAAPAADHRPERGVRAPRTAGEAGKIRSVL